MRLPCPACGAEVVFKSRASVFAICSFCNSTLVRHDMDLESFGKMSLIPQDMSPLQIGTSGIFENSKFEVVGRQKISWSQGTWNEWYLHFDDGRDGWLADAQGLYMVSFQVMDQQVLPELKKLIAGDSVRIGRNLFTVNDVRDVTCVGSQGELPVRGVQGRQSTSVDLLGDQHQFGNIDYSSEGDRFFLGKYVDVEDLKFLNLREFDGW